MTTRRTLALIISTMVMTSGVAQEKLTEEEIKSTAQQIENDWRYGSNHVIWMENQNTLSRYLETAPLRCLDELEEVVGWSQEPHEANLRILQLKQQIYPNPGSKKSERSLSRYFTDTEKAKQKFIAAEEMEKMYQRLIKETAPIIEAKKQKTFTAPQGELTYFYYHLGGGMVNRPAYQAILERRKDGKYIVALDTDDFHKLDTIPLTQAHVDTIRQMLIEGEVYKMPAFYDSPLLILDAPSGSVSVKFTDASYSCNNIPPFKWGGECIEKVYQYLKTLQPEHKKTE